MALHYYNGLQCASILHKVSLSKKDPVSSRGFKFGVRPNFLSLPLHLSLPNNQSPLNKADCP